MIARTRSAIFAVWMLGVTLAFGLAGFGVRLFAPHRALPFARRWAGAVLAGLWPLCRIRIVVTGLAHVPAEGAVLLASQHQSAFDTLVWMTLLARPSYIMKQELRRMPLVGPLLEPAGMIPVDRSAGAAALRGLLAATASAAGRARQIVIFPQGTRTLPGQIVRLHPGVAAIAARTGLAVLPVATDSGLCWPRGTFAKRAGTIHIVIGPPLAGRGREELLASLESFWCASEAAAYGTRAAVDKAVEPL